VGWKRGQAEIERQLARRELEPVAPSGELAQRLLVEARAHVRSARRALGSDGADDPVKRPTPVPPDAAGALQLAYDAARKAAASLLAAQGLRATTTGGHTAVIRATEAQFSDRFGEIDWVRRRRHDSEYPDLTTPGVTVEEAIEAIAVAEQAIEWAEQILESGRLGVWA
jgi:HEPN domain-containing protein